MTPAKGQKIPDWANDPTVRAHMESDWNASHPNAPEVPGDLPGSIKQERGGWVVQNADGSYDVQPFPPGTA